MFYKDSWMKSSEIRKQIESKYAQSDIIIVKGISPGNCNVATVLSENNFQVNCSQ